MVYGSGDGLTDTEVRSLAFQIITGGFGTTVNLIGNGTLALLTHREELARLRADPSRSRRPSRSCCGSRAP